MDRDRDPWDLFDFKVINYHVKTPPKKRKHIEISDKIQTNYEVGFSADDEWTLIELKEEQQEPVIQKKIFPDPIDTSAFPTIKNTKKSLSYALTETQKEIKVLEKKKKNPHTFCKVTSFLRKIIVNYPFHLLPKDINHFYCSEEYPY